jgi:hypothetical protein
MRNLLQRPITPKEVLDALELAFQREDDNDTIGGIDAMCLQGILVYLRDNPRATMTIAESLRVNE